MLQKVDQKFTFHNKRKRGIITPCCKRHNKDGKFVNYKGLPDNYGYCHSCGKATLPQTRYTDNQGNYYIYNDTTKRMEKTLELLYDKNVIQPYDNVLQSCHTLSYKSSIKQQFIDFNTVYRLYDNQKENNLLLYLRNTFGNTDTDLVKKMYYIGTTKDMGTVFWNINKENRVQKAKVSYYKLNGKRTNKFNAPYKNSDGYYSCLFGEHLLNNFKDKAVILVESEKTAIVCTMHFTEYLWLAYGGINGLTESKIQVLKGRKTIIVPDMSENAVSIANKKHTVFKNLGIDAKVWDLTNGKTDSTLKKEGLYNCDLEDIIRKSKNSLPHR